MFSLVKKTQLLMSLTLVSCMFINDVRDWASASGPKLVYYRELPLYDQMIPRLEEYNKTLDWKWKVYPLDMPYLNTTNDILNVEAYVRNPKEAEVHSRNRGDTQIQTIFYVYQALDEQVKILSQCSPTYLYKSKFTPIVSMKIEKDLLSEIASLPFVYCIRIIPEPKATAVSIDEARTYNDLIHTQSFHDKTVDPMDIAIIGQGYEFPESYPDYPDTNSLNGEAGDNIEYRWDFWDSDPDVTDGYNAHDTECLDLLARAFGDVGDDNEMYDDPDIYSVLKIAYTYYVWWQGEPIEISEWGGERDAIEWCILNDMEVVFMCFTTEPETLGIPEFVCNGWWCDLFWLGVKDGVTWVAGAGNLGATWGVGYPAESHWVIAVGSYESVNEITGEASRSDFSNYGDTWYADVSYIYCPTCFGAGGLVAEFKPNIYDAGQIQGVGLGTSYATPLAAASIALGIYSQPSEPTDQAWIPGYEFVHDTIALCNEWVVMPPECSQQGDVTDTHTLWHRSVTDDNYELTVRTYKLGDGEINNVNVWIDATQYSSPVENLVVACGDHTVEVESPFFDQDGRRYAFQSWDDDDTSNPRTVTIIDDTTLRADYIREPVCAMKTKTNGYFYIPDVATDLLKIEMLSDNEDFTGDQTGPDPSPYEPIEHWPDGIVDIDDVSFICSKFGSWEGKSDWDYMADITGLEGIPDGVVDIEDVTAAVINFGNHNGGYITDLEGVTVTFNTGEEITPDNGFVAIPQNPDTDNFTVERYGIPIGATITFW